MFLWYSCVCFSAFGSLNVRGLLDMRSHCLQEFNFTDPYSQVSGRFILWEQDGLVVCVSQSGSSR